MPTFDVVSKIDMQEVDNALNQTRKEVGQRYDFRGSKTSVEQKEDVITIISDDDYKLKAVVDVLQTKMVKRKISLKAFDYAKAEPASGGLVKQAITIKQGISTEKAKEIVKHIKSTKIKVQAQIQPEQVRVSGKKRDLLQECITILKEKDFGLDLQFVNFRD
ncbi:YajQ family cyclic di-GMP-binding protein [Thermodesulfobacteriota bacterium]